MNGSVNSSKMTSKIVTQKRFSSAPSSRERERGRAERQPLREVYHPESEFLTSRHMNLDSHVPPSGGVLESGSLSPMAVREHNYN